MSEVLNYVSDALFAVDGRMRVQIWNRGMEELTGFGSSEVLQRQLFEVLPFLRGTLEAQYLSQGLEGRANKSQNAPYSFTPNSRRRLEASYVPLKSQLDFTAGSNAAVASSNAGAATGTCGAAASAPAAGCLVVIKDLTTIEALSVEVAEREDRFRIMADSAPVLLWMCDPEGRCTFFNKRWLSFTGQSMGKEIDFGWAEGVHPEDFQFCMDTFTAALVKRAEFSMEYRLRRHDGEFRWVYDIGMPRFITEGKFAGYIGSCVDVTDRKQIEMERELLLTSERGARTESERLVRELERLSAVKDGFLATISHELRTPLNAVVGWSEILKSGGYTPEDFELAIDTIERNAKIQATLVNDLLDLSKIIAGKMELEVSAVNLADLVRNVSSSVSHAAHSKNLVIGFDFDDSIGPISGDAERLQQVVWNLLTNAIRHTQESGTITIELNRDSSTVYLRVKDSGEGIPQDFLPFVFDRFSQADSSVTRRHGGLGIGLAIVKQITELHGGRVKVDSAGLGKGATFTVELPLVTVRISGGHKPFAPKAKKLLLENIRVLAVDDQHDTLLLVETILKRQGATVFTAGSVNEALRVIGAEQLDIIVTDIGMPGEGGYDLIRKVKAKKNPEVHVPFIALTAHARREDREYAFSLGFDMHLAKPIEAQNLLSTIERLTAARRRIQ
jgi:PAS domain S-box-containing protein